MHKERLHSFGCLSIVYSPPRTACFSRPYVRLAPVCVCSRACTSVHLNPIIRPRPSTSVLVRLRPCPYVCVRACMSVSVPIRLRPCPCICVRVRASAFVCVHIIKIQTRLHALSAMRLDAFFAQTPSRCTIHTYPRQICIHKYKHGQNIYLSAFTRLAN